MTSETPSPHALSACPYCGRLLAPGATFERSWHVGLTVGPERPVNCCMTERYLRLQRERQQEAERQRAAAAAAQRSGPINIAPGARRGPPPGAAGGGGAGGGQPPRTIPL